MLLFSRLGELLCPVGSVDAVVQQVGSAAVSSWKCRCRCSAGWVSCCVQLEV